MSKAKNQNNNVTSNDVDTYKRFSLMTVSSDELVGEPIRLYYIPVKQAELWEKNPKKHDQDAIIESIQQYGFKDPPAWDNTLEGLVEGNGRTTALSYMEDHNYDVPRGILINGSTGEWCIPIVFGVDAESKSQAERYAIDHNNLTMMGGDFTIHDIKKMWNSDEYLDVLHDINDSGEMPVSISAEDMQFLLLDFSPEFGDKLFDEEENATEDEEEIDTEMGNVKITVRRAQLINATGELRKLIDEHPEWEAEMESTT